MRAPFRLASTEQRNERFPELGEHTGELLAELGYSSDEVACLTAAAGGPAADRRPCDE